MHARKEDIQNLGRLKKRSEFLHARNAGSKWVSKSLILQTVPNNKQGRRFGLVVSKKLSKSAVDRNRIKRRLRAAACEVLALHGRDNTDYVLIGRPETQKKLYQDIVKDLKWCLKKLDLLDE